MIYLGIAIISELMDKITTTADIYLKKNVKNLLWRYQRV